VTGVPDDDLLARLLALSRSAVPAEAPGGARAYEHVRQHWLGELRRRRSARRRRFAVFAVAATVSVALIAGLRARREDGGAAPIEVATLELARGSAAPQGPLVAGCTLATDAASRLALRTRSGHSVRLDVSTRVRLVSGDELALESGAVYVDSAGPAGPATDSLTVDTSFGRLSDLGTQFEARIVGDELRVRVREGQIALAGPAGTTGASAGQELDVAATGTATRRAIDLAGGEWAWVESVAPPFDIHGRKLHELLVWAARERGLRLHFADLKLARTALEVQLSGSVEGMTPEEALRAVLPTCGMTQRSEHGVLLVEPLDAAAQP